MATPMQKHEQVAVPFVDLRVVHETVRGEILDDLGDAIDRSAFTEGAPVASFERAFAEWVGTNECVGVASGLDALRIGLLALGIVPGDEVIVPAMTFIATYEAVVQAGGIPVPVDVREDDCGLDVEAAAAACGPRTRFIMPVHLYGQMVDVVALRTLAERADVVIVEDACQAHGAMRAGVAAGTAGAAAGFSFYPSKNLGAMGDAGAIVTDDAEVAARARAMRSHGQTRRYHSEYLGYTSRLDAIQATILSRKLPHLNDWNEQRRLAAARYDDLLAGVGDLILPAVVEGSTHVWHLYAVRTADPEALGRSLADRGIGTGRHYPEPPPFATPFAAGIGAGAFPVAEAIGRTTLSLPLFPGITEAQQHAVVEAVRSHFEHPGR